MTHQLSPYISFNGQAREALDFYAGIFGGTPRVQSFGDMQVPGMPAEHLMHGELTTDAGWTIMAADPVPADQEITRGGTNLCVWGDDEQAMRRQFEALAEGGQVSMPLEKQMWGDTYGDLTDRFGINWGFNVSTGERG